MDNLGAKIVAVSGGIDSMVLLDLMIKKFGKENLLVAHFDHGTRPSSLDDCNFVANFCEKNQIEFIYKRANLGANVSEEKARKARYDFLFKLAKEKNSTIYTAHHLDDLAESVAINFLRGTGWRGLAPLNAKNIHRPFLDPEIFNEAPYDKKSIYIYAGKNEIIYREDPTNSSENYLRNRLRPLVKNLSDKNKKDLFGLWQRQKEIKREIEEILLEILPEDNFYWRSWFSEMDDETAGEILRAALEKQNVFVTYPQLYNFLAAVRTYAPAKSFNLPNGKLVKFSKSGFSLEQLSKK